MKFIKSFTEYSKVSEGLRYHVDNDLDITDSIYRIGSDAYKNLFEEVKQYWDKGNIVLKDKAAWMAKNLEVGKEATYHDRDSGKDMTVELDSPKRGGDKKFYVYHNSGRTKDGKIVAVRIEWGDTSGLSIKNDDPEAAASFWARQQCDSKKDPKTAGFWACYAPSLFGKQLGLSSTEPW